MALAVASILAPSLAPAQGPVTPPGAPGATMKALDQIEARTIVNAANCPATATYAFGISAAQYPGGGSFYLTGNLVIPSGTGGLYISANNVTVNLNGFSISNAGGTSLYNGVFIIGTNVTILNGTVSGAGFSTGITGSTANNRVSAVSVSGTTSGGISLTGAGSIVQGSSVNGTGGIGIRADAVSDSAAIGTGSTAIFAKTISNVFGTTAGNGPAVVPTPDSTTLATVQAAVGAIEPRTNLRTMNTPGDSTSVFVITQPGSYYLTGNVAVTGSNNVVNGIRIRADNVTLDLNGFMVSSTTAGAAGSGVLLDGSAAGADNANVTIFNGFIRGTTTSAGFGNFTLGGFSYGISLGGATVNNGRVSRVSVGGVGSSGIFVQGGAVEACSVTTAALFGIFAGSARGCDVSNAGFVGINASLAEGCAATGCQKGIQLPAGGQASGCQVSASDTGYALGAGCNVVNCAARASGSTGYLAVDNANVVGCTSSNVTGGTDTAIGFQVNSGCSIMNCSATGHRGGGFLYAGACHLFGNVARGNAGSSTVAHGFRGTGTNNRLDGNHAIGNSGTGILASSGTADFIVRNTSSGNAPNDSPASGTNIGPVGTPPAHGRISDPLGADMAAGRGKNVS